LTEKVRIDEQGRVGIGTTTANAKLHVVQNDSAAARIGGSSYYLDLGQYAASSSPAISYNGSGASLIIRNGTSEAARFDSSSRLLVGTSSSPSASQGANSNLVVQGYVSQPTSGGIISLQRGQASASITSDQLLGRISFNGSDGYSFADISARTGAAAGVGDYPGVLVFSTTADGASSPTERMRITSAGNVVCNPANYADYRETTGGAFLAVYGNQDTAATASAEWTCANIGLRYHIAFSNPNGVVGSISTTASATAYTTSSDYRLKENVVPLTGAVDRVNQLQVHRFNFIADPDKTVDGFIAHEAQAVVPEAVTGTHDEVDDDGNPVYQGIDQSKLVPLLTAALQEALAEIEGLKTRITALEGGN